MKKRTVPQNKRKIKIICIIIVVLILISTSFVKIELFGAPVFIKMPIKDGKTVKLSDISEIYVNSEKNNINRAETILKYNNQVNSIHIVGNNMSDIDFIPEKNNITQLVSESHIDNWNGIERCNNLTSLIIMYSNFSDISLLKNMNNLNYIQIESSEQINYCDFYCFQNLNYIQLQVPNVDIEKIITAPKLETLWIMQSEDIFGYDKIKNNSSLKKILINNSDIDIALIETCTSIPLDYLSIGDCRLHESNENTTEILNSIANKGFDVEHENGLINIKSHE